MKFILLGRVVDGIRCSSSLTLPSYPESSAMTASRGILIASGDDRLYRGQRESSKGTVDQVHRNTIDNLAGNLDLYLRRRLVWGLKERHRCYVAIP